VLAFAGIAVSLAWVSATVQLFVQLLVVEAAVAAWYWRRIRSTPVDVLAAPLVPGQVTASDTL
jgi:hypothetical protein